MEFINVSAVKCNENGEPIPPVEWVSLELNESLIGGYRGNEVLLIGVEFIKLGRDYYTGFQIAKGIQNGMVY